MNVSDNRVAREILRSAITKELNFEEIIAESLEEWALVILWSASEPQRVGEVALLGQGGDTWLLGRCPFEESSATPVPNDGQPSWDSGRPVSFVRQRPRGFDGSSHADSGPPFVLGAGISRRQVEIQATDEGLSLRNIGRCPLLVNGQWVKSGLARMGATIHLRDQLLLLCTKRRRTMPECRGFPAAAVRDFGKADQFGVVGESPATWLLRERAALLAPGRANILILGESGTGKELTAQALHGLSDRRDQPLVATNIAAIAPGLASVQLFGNRKGFPESKMPESKGLVGAADGATLFLDEIGDMPLEVQPMFLRVTEERREYQRLGEEDRPARRSDFRLLGATNRPEKLRIELKRRFPRVIQIPPLQERREDIPLLVHHILSECRNAGDSEASRFFEEDQPRLHPLLIEYLVHHDYHTHVAEIGLLLGQAMAHSRGRVLNPCLAWLHPQKKNVVSEPSHVQLGPEIISADVHADIASGDASLLPPVQKSNPLSASESLPQGDEAIRLLQDLRSRIDHLSETERHVLRDLINVSYKASHGDHTEAAASLGLNRFQLYRLLRRLDVKPMRVLALK